MTRDEFKTWGFDVLKRLPETGRYVTELPRDTRDCWFEDVFANLELRDCIAANQRLMSTGIKAFDRERLPAIISGHAQAIAFERRERERVVAERKRRRLQRGILFDDAAAESFDPLMRRCFIALCDYQRCHREEHAQSISAEQRREYVANYFVENGTISIRPENEPRCKCIYCRDTGFVPVERDDRRMYGHCRCDKGERVHERFSNTRNGIGPAFIRESTFDDFNDR